MLGGAITPDVSAARGAVALNEAAERITATAELARRYPNARIIFSGGSRVAALWRRRRKPRSPSRQFEALGIAHDRITAEEQSRNTIENARVLAADRQPEARRALAAGDVGLSHAARDRRRFARRVFRSKPIRSIGARAAPLTRCGRSIGRRWTAPDRYGGARMGRPCGLSADRQD